MISRNKNGMTGKSWMRFSLFLVVVLSFLAGCAPPLPAMKPVDLVWPLPPDEPRIKFLQIISSTLDFNKKQGISEALFGEEDVVGFRKPYGVTVDKEGRIYVTDLGRVTVFDFAKKQSFFIGADPGVGQLQLAIGIALASDGRLFVTDVSAHKVYVYRDRKCIATIGEAGELDSPSGIALDEKRGLIYVVDSQKHSVNVYSLANYSAQKTIGKRGDGEGEFNFPTNIAVDAEGKLYVSDTGNIRVEVLDADGKFLRFIGTIGDTPGSLARPKGIAVDSEGNIYVVDTAFQNFQIFNQEGRILLSVGSGGQIGPGNFLLPAGIMISEEDKIYVVDQLPGSVQIFQYLGKKWKQRQEGH